jgi:pyridoxamine 5'-phosphate oxidase
MVVSPPNPPAGGVPPSATGSLPCTEGLPSADLTALRREYGNRPFEPDDLASTWWEQFGVWFSDASGLTEPNAMVVATVDPSGCPRARTVLLKAVEPAGFLWATNYRSRKGRDLDTSGRAGLLFPWHDLQRQVHAEGPVERISAAESDRIWDARPRASQLSALASHQSEVVGSRAEIEERIRELDAAYLDIVPRPEHWGGYRLRPRVVEFWQGRVNRLHDRLRFRCVGEPLDPAGWTVERLEP